MKRYIHKYITGQPLIVNILAAIALVLLVVVLFMASLRWMTQHGVASTVPSLVGKSLAQVEQIVEEKDFELIVQDSVYYDSLPPTMVIKQIPEADEVVKVNRTIYITINRASAPEINMPNLLNYNFRTAEMTLKSLGLKLGDTTYRPDFAKNYVLEQTYEGQPIPAGAKIRVGSKISLVLGAGVGVEEMPVPQVTGMLFAEARVLIEANGLTIGSVIKDGTVTDEAAAFVIRQNPPARNEKGRTYRMRPGQMMDVWLSAEPPVRDTTPATNNPPIIEDQQP